MVYDVFTQQYQISSCSMFFKANSGNHTTVDESRKLLERFKGEIKSESINPEYRDIL